MGSTSRREEFSKQCATGVVGCGVVSGRLADVDGHAGRKTGPQRRAFGWIHQRDPDGHALDNLHEVPRGVVGRQE